MRTLAVAHDAGGAEMLSAWCGDAGAGELLICAAGPARTIFERDWPAAPRAGLDAIGTLGGADRVVTGTSLEDRTEFAAWRRARARGVPSACFLDHWDMYLDRFPRGAEFLPSLPDEVWVGDEYAWAKASADGFPAERLRLVPNPYLAKIRRQAALLPPPPPARGLRVLYICEPIHLKIAATFSGRESEFDTEWDNLASLLRACSGCRTPVERVTIRLHPREPADKYDAVIAADGAGLPVVKSVGTPLVQDIIGHAMVVGIESMGLVVAMTLGRRTVSCITGRPWTISLPHREIVRIGDHAEIFSIPDGGEAGATKRNRSHTR